MANCERALSEFDVYGYGYCASNDRPDCEGYLSCYGTHKINTIKPVLLHMLTFFLSFEFDDRLKLTLFSFPVILQSIENISIKR